MEMNSRIEGNNKKTIYNQAHFDDRVKTEGSEAIKKGLEFIIHGMPVHLSGQPENPWHDGYLALMPIVNDAPYLNKKYLEKSLRFAKQQLKEVGESPGEIAENRPQAEKATIRAVMPSVIQKIEEKLAALEKSN